MTALPDISEFLPTKDGFCRPDWAAIADRIEANVPKPEWKPAWETASRQWVDRLCGQFGADYRIHETPNFLIITEAPEHIALEACRSFEEALKRILDSLPGVALVTGFGKHVVLMFTRLEEYYHYIASFFPEGEHPMSGGLCLGGGHFAFPTPDFSSYRTVLVHELTHGCLAHLPIPAWLNEALAMRMETVICGSNQLRFDSDVYDRHLAFWNADSIQTFWTGESWQIPGESFELSYSLAEVLWRKLEVDLEATREQVLRFVAAAQANDGAEGACQSVFGKSLGDLASDFLGPGDWKPNPTRWTHDQVAPNSSKTLPPIPPSDHTPPPCS